MLRFVKFQQEREEMEIEECGYPPVLRA